MKDFINGFLNKNVENKFIFNRNSNSPTKHLSQQTQAVPNSPGLYLIFCPQQFYIDELHLTYEFNGVNYTLIYFGKAGGKTKEGRSFDQGLNGKINNVISDSSRNLKDIKRAEYWEIIMNEFNIDYLEVFFDLNESSQVDEDMLYSYLDKNSLKYPFLNKEEVDPNTRFELYLDK